MIDIHCHILPGIDDGAESWGESVGMARAAAAEGITRIIATPHHANGRWWNKAEDVRRLVDELNLVLTEEGVPIVISSGQEIRVTRDLKEGIQEGKLLTLNDSPYFLIEFPSSRVPANMKSLIQELKALGVAPVIAHPERNLELSQGPEKLAELLKEGALCQATSHSINGFFGKKTKERTLEWCGMNMIHFIASDAHSQNARGFGMVEAFREIGRSLGSEYADYFQKNADLLFAKMPILPWEPKKKKKLWSLFSQQTFSNEK